MNQHGLGLLRHLENLVRLNERLLQLVEQRYAAMASRDASGLEAVLAEERQVAQAVFEEECRRRQTLSRLGESLGRPTDDAARMKLSDAAALVGSPLKERLVGQSDRLRATVERIRRKNHTATLLAQQMLPHFSELLEILLAGGSAGTSYTAGGQAIRGSAPCMSVLDMQA
ncbi:MAG: flagellar protein FlgN [Planctomycetes bacterium]|nr:flagellar protein FlgN [Planctomycetota bacterium]